jgi:phage N-6-adenine-methyltransferase
MQAPSTDNLFESLKQSAPSSKMRVHFSSQTDEWATPADLFAELDSEFHFTLDVCALPHNAKCERHFTPEMDGLVQPWSGVCYMNPPYGKRIGEWVKKAYESSQAGATVVCLLPARTDTRWWHEYVTRAEVRFIQGRLRFGKAVAPAPFPSAVVVFRAPRTSGTRWKQAFFRKSRPCPPSRCLP